MKFVTVSWLFHQNPDYITEEKFLSVNKWNSCTSNGMILKYVTCGLYVLRNRIDFYFVLWKGDDHVQRMNDPIYFLRKISISVEPTCVVCEPVSRESHDMI
jgi:hypothetical protein